MKLSIEYAYRKSEVTKTIALKKNQEHEFGRISQDISLDVDPRLSRRHFSIKFDGSAIIVTHLSKVNPTHLALVNEEKFHSVNNVETVTEDCVIQAGNHRYFVVLERDDSSFGDSPSHFTSTISKSEEWEVDAEDSPKSGGKAVEDEKDDGNTPLNELVSRNPQITKQISDEDSLVEKGPSVVDSQIPVAQEEQDPAPDKPPVTASELDEFRDSDMADTPISCEDDQFFTDTGNETVNSQTASNRNTKPMLFPDLDDD